MMDYNRLLGNYNTTFFSIHLFDEDLSTYIHEYVHHIQNITTPYGLMYCTSRLIYLLHIFITNPNSDLYNSVHRLWKKNKNMIEKVIKQVGVASDFDYHDGVIENIDFHRNKKVYNKYGANIIDKVTIKLRVNDDIKDIPFTVRMIKENMARLIQNHCFPQSCISKNVTYFMIEEVIEKYYPEFPINEQTVVALCDISLVADSPIHAFFNFLDYLKRFDSTQINAKFMYECVENEKMICLYGNFRITELLDWQLDKCCKAIDAFYLNFASGTQISNWIKEICCRGVEFRKNHFSFLYYVMDNSLSQLESQALFFRIVEMLGFTIEKDKNNQFKIPENIALVDFVHLIALEEYTSKIIDNRNGKTSPCSLKKFCEVYVRNDTISAGFGTRNIRTVTFDDLAGQDINSVCTAVVSDECANPFCRSIDDNLCPFTYIRRNINQANE